MKSKVSNISEEEMLDSLREEIPNFDNLDQNIIFDDFRENKRK